MKKNQKTRWQCSLEHLRQNLVGVTTESLTTELWHQCYSTKNVAGVNATCPLTFLDVSSTSLSADTIPDIKLFNAVEELWLAPTQPRLAYPAVVPVQGASFVTGSITRLNSDVALKPLALALHKSHLDDDVARHGFLLDVATKIPIILQFAEKNPSMPGSLA